jgi:hypothetical protein
MSVDWVALLVTGADMGIFADTEQTHAWEQHLKTVPATERDVTLPEGPALLEALHFLAIPEEDIPDVVVAADTVRNDSDLWWYVERAVWSIVAHMGDVEAPPRIAVLHDINDPAYRYFYVIVYVAALPFTRDYHRQIGIPDDISQQTLADVGRNVQVHHKREGIGGLGVAWWLTIHFRGVIYQLGRLQFERSQLSPSLAESVKATGADVVPETPALSLHIPDFCGSMSAEACDESIAMARTFFPTYFQDTPYDYAVCHSWLLDPRLKQHLRADSNIIRFQDRFHIADAMWDSTEGIMQFVFGKKPADIDAIEPRTSLERAVVEHIRNGGAWYGYGGWFQLDDSTRERM